jgi:light-independent protochlorophyllide reductase subunit B
MRMSYWEYQGTAHTGVARVACSMKDMHGVFYSPVGDSYIHSIFTMMERFDHFPPITTSTLDAQTLGMGVNKLPDTLRQVYKDHKPKVIALACTCSSTLLQEDLGALARTAELPENEIDILVYAPNPYRMEEDESANGLLTLLTEKYASQPLPPTEKPSVNIIGPISLGFHHKQDLISLRRMLAALNLEINVIFPQDASIDDVRNMPRAWATIAPYREMGYEAALHLEKTLGIPAVTTTPIGVGLTRQWVREVLAAVAKFAAAHGLAFDAKEPALQAFSMDQLSKPSVLPWFSYTADTQSFTGRKAYVFGDYTHAAALCRLLSEEMDITVLGAGTYTRKLAKEFKEAVAPYTDDVLITVEFDQVRKKIAELGPDFVLGTQMERHTAAGFDIPCGVISSPSHIEDYPLGYQPFLGYDGSNFVTDRIYHTMTLGLEKHLIEMFGDAGLGETGGSKEEEAMADSAETEKITHNFADAQEREVKAQQLAVEGGPAAPLPHPAAPVQLTWTAEAQKAMKGIPFFVRPKVQKRVEDYARLKGISVITIDLVYEVKEKAGA